MPSVRNCQSPDQNDWTPLDLGRIEPDEVVAVHPAFRRATGGVRGVHMSAHEVSPERGGTMSGRRLAMACSPAREGG